MEKEKPVGYNADEISRFFDEQGIEEWNRLEKTPVDEVSLYVHTHYLKEYIQPGMRVLEIGAGAGRFTHVLAGLGARVVVGDISPVQLDLNKQHANQLGFADAVEAWELMDICEMTGVETASFDCVVAYGGPLSYALDRRDDGLAECIRVLKPGGLLLLSVMSLWGSAHFALPFLLEYPPETNRKVISSGDLSTENMPDQDSQMHMFRADELRGWLEDADLEVLAMSASGCLSLTWNDHLETIREDEEKWTQLLVVELEAAASPGAQGMGTHMIAVAKKG